MLNGKWTFLTAIVAVLYGIAGFLFGFGDANQNIEAILLGSGLFGLRRAIK